MESITRYIRPYTMYVHEHTDFKLMNRVLRGVRKSAIIFTSSILVARVYIRVLVSISSRILKFSICVSMPYTRDDFRVHSDFVLVHPYSISFTNR